MGRDADLKAAEKLFSEVGNMDGPSKSSLDRILPLVDPLNVLRRLVERVCRIQRIHGLQGQVSQRCRTVVILSSVFTEIPGKLTIPGKPGGRSSCCNIQKVLLNRTVMKESTK